MNWEQLPNGKWRPQKKPIAPGKIDPDSPDYERRVRAGLKKKWVYCEDCKAKYNLADPCIHHLTDSPRDRKKYDDENCHLLFVLNHQNYHPSLQ